MTNGHPIFLIFMLEEYSAKCLLEEILPKILPDDVVYRCVPHNGCGDLRKSIPLKLNNWNIPNSFFVILHDLDDKTDCKKLKDEISELCKNARQHNPLIRIVCRELEAWYFGDLDAVEKAYPKFKAANYKNKYKYKFPDSIASPSRELNRIFENSRIYFDKVESAKEISKHMNVTGNKSPSFNCTIKGVTKLVNDQLGGN